MNYTKEILIDECNKYEDLYPFMMGILDSMIKRKATNKELKEAMKDFKEVRSKKLYIKSKTNQEENKIGEPCINCKKVIDEKTIFSVDKCDDCTE